MDFCIPYFHYLFTNKLPLVTFCLLHHTVHGELVVHVFKAFLLCMVFFSMFHQYFMTTIQWRSSSPNFFAKPYHIFVLTASCLALTQLVRGPWISGPDWGRSKMFSTLIVTLTQRFLLSWSLLFFNPGVDKSREHISVISVQTVVEPLYPFVSGQRKKVNATAKWLPFQCCARVSCHQRAENSPPVHIHGTAVHVWSICVSYIRSEDEKLL